jgi:hypothetical protein
MSAAYVPGEGLPIALPFGSSVSEQEAQVRAASSETTGPNTPQPSASEQRERRLSRRALEQLDRTLPERDRAVLDLVAVHRFLTTRQLERFVFTGHASEDTGARVARKVLARLERSLLLAPLDRRIGGVRSGSSARIWQLTSGAARLLRDDGVNFRRPDPSPRFLAHCLAVGDVHLALRDLQTTLPVTIDVEVEPDSWRPFTGPSGERRTLQPDLAAVVHAQTFDERWFLEMDLSTESLNTLLKKCGQYEAYRATGIEQANHGAFPLVWWIMTNPERAERLAATIRRTPRLTPALYRVVLIDELAARLSEALS